VRDKKGIRFAVVATRLFLGAFFLTAGLSKLIQGFPGVIGPVWLEEKATPYGLALFARFVAYAEAIVGAMLLTRFATLGAIMLFPMLFCILMVTMSMGWRGTPCVNGFLLVLNAGLLAYDWPKLKHIIADDAGPASTVPLKRQAPKWDLLWLAGMAAFVTGMLLLRSVGGTAEYLTYTGLVAMIICPLAVKWKEHREAA